MQTMLRKNLSKIEKKGNASKYNVYTADYQYDISDLHVVLYEYIDILLYSIFIVVLYDYTGKFIC